MTPILYRWDVYAHRSGRSGPGPWCNATKGKLTRAFRSLRLPRERLRVRYDNGQEIVFKVRRLQSIVGVPEWLSRLHQAQNTCQITRADRWRAKEGTTHYFGMFRFNAGTGPLFVRLFPDQDSLDFFVRRVRKHAGVRPHATGRVTFKRSYPR